MPDKKQPTSKKAYISETSETETEPDTPMTIEDQAKSRQWKIGALKPAAEPKPPKSIKGAGEKTKRIVVGIMVFSWACVPIFVHPLCSCLLLAPMTYLLHSEAHYIKMKPFEGKGHRQLLFLILNYMFLPYVSSFQRDVLEKSGLSVETNPLLFMVLYEKHNLISLVLGVLMTM